MRASFCDNEIEPFPLERNKGNAVNLSAEGFFDDGNIGPSCSDGLHGGKDRKSVV